MKKSIRNESGVSFSDFYNKGASQIVSKSADERRGVPIGNFVYQSQCHGITKDGSECNARPVKGGNLCAGHRKQAKAMTGRNE